MAKSEISLSVTPTATAMVVEPGVREKAKSVLERLIKEETRMVKGRFRCFETPGSSQKITVKKYKDVPMFVKEMVDGGVYEVPLYVARFLNGIDMCARAVNGQIGTCSYGIHGFKWDDVNNQPARSQQGFGPGGEGGIPVPIVGITSRIRRFGFESLDFESSTMEFEDKEKVTPAA